MMRSMKNSKVDDLNSSSDLVYTLLLQPLLSCHPSARQAEMDSCITGSRTEVTGDKEEQITQLDSVISLNYWSKIIHSHIPTLQCRYE